jgi:hypothetical protein
VYTVNYCTAKGRDVKEKRDPEAHTGGCLWLCGCGVSEQRTETERQGHLSVSRLPRPSAVRRSAISGFIQSRASHSQIDALKVRVWSSIVVVMPPGCRGAPIVIVVVSGGSAPAVVVVHR